MKKFILLFLVIWSAFYFFPQHVSAVEDPLAVPNNKFGISILFDSEVDQAAQFIDTSGGDWGYVTIPIQVGDRNLYKWQHFMDSCKRLHLIPIIRLATEGDYANTKVWRAPSAGDIVDFSYFLNSLQWPTQNRYVIVFNEVNRFDEWGGSVNPSDYARILSYAVTAFKSKNRDFFIISAGLDNAAPNQGTQYMDEYDFMKQMDAAVPGIFNQIDGLASHSYPNPGFSQPPTTDNTMGVASFSFERTLAQSLATKKLPIFITETGWSSAMVSSDTQISYYQQALNTIWNDPGIVAITPFLLNAAIGPFQEFSFFGSDGLPTKQYTALRDIPKAKGSPALAPTETPIPSPTPLVLIKKSVRVLGAETERTSFSPNIILAVERFFMQFYKK